MTKHISSLVKDIYDLFENDGPDIDEQELTSNLNHFSEQLEQHIKTFLFEKRSKNLSHTIY